MRKIFLLLSFVLFIIPITTSAKATYLYDVFEAEENQSYVHEYLGEHHDSYTEEPSKKIYHWYSTSDSTSNTIKEKDNVLFANKCWIMYRTTDTGGVKLLYNGVAIDNKCSTDRSTYSPVYSRGDGYIYLGHDSRFVGDGYEYNPTTHKFNLTGNVVAYSWSSSTYQNFLGKWICLNADMRENCDSVYYVQGYRNNEYAYILKYEYENRVQDGVLGIESFSAEDSNNDRTFLNGIGWKTNIDNTRTLLDTNNNTVKPIDYTTYFKNYTDYYYADDVSYNASTNTYTLVNPFQVTSSTLENAENKYTFYSSSSGYSGANVYYHIKAVPDTKAYYYYLESAKGKKIGDYQYNLIYGTGYTKNSDGTYSISSPTKKSSLEYLDYYANINGKYICKESTTNKCDILWKVTSATETSFTYQDFTEYKLSKTYSYQNGKYTLNGNTIKTVQLVTNSNQKGNTGYYTCMNSTGTCEVAYYIYFTYGKTISYIELHNGEGYSEAFDTKDDSRIKKAVDLWYEKELLDYSDYIEETIYCDNKDETTIDGKFITYGNNNTLSCPREIDQYSIDNPKAELDYSIGLITYPEILLLNNGEMIRSTRNGYYTMTPKNKESKFVNYYYVASSYSLISYTYLTSYYGIRPVISLSNDMAVEKGNGSTNNPYVVYQYKKYNIDVAIVDETDEINIHLNDLTSVDPGEEVSFKITPIYGYQVNSIEIKGEDEEVISYQESDTPNEYTFIMPEQNVTIRPVYERKSSQVIPKKENAKEFVIEVANASAVVYENTVKFIVVPEDNYEVYNIDIIDEDDNKIDYQKTTVANEYQFVMPGTDVVITPYFKLIELVNPQTNSSAIVVKIILLSLLLVSFAFIYKKYICVAKN